MQCSIMKDMGDMSVEEVVDVIKTTESVPLAEIDKICQIFQGRSIISQLFCIEEKDNVSDFIMLIC